MPPQGRLGVARSVATAVDLLQTGAQFGKAEMLVQKLDTDGDGGISRSEFKAAHNEL